MASPCSLPLDERRPPIKNQVTEVLLVSRVNELVRGRRSMTPADVAMRLARSFGTSATVWMGLQTEYDLNLAAANRDIQKIKPREAA